MLLSFKTVLIAWVLMSRRTTKVYLEVFAALKEIHPGFNPRRCMTDFEKALQNALKTSFPGIKVFGCYFHFCQVQCFFLKNSLFENREKSFLVCCVHSPVTHAPMYSKWGRKSATVNVFRNGERILHFVLRNLRTGLSLFMIL